MGKIKKGAFSPLMINEYFEMFFLSIYTTPFSSENCGLSNGMHTAKNAFDYLLLLAFSNPSFFACAHHQVFVLLRFALFPNVE